VSRETEKHFRRPERDLRQSNPTRRIQENTIRKRAAAQGEIATSSHPPGGRSIRAEAAPRHFTGI